MPELNTLLFPPSCAGCGVFGVVLCARCINMMRSPSTYWCLTCGNTYFSENSGCLGQKPHKRVVVVPFWDYDSLLKKLIWRMKYVPDKSLLFEMLLLCPLGPLATVFHAKDTVSQAPPILVPVPLHPSRERGRGFNQSVVIAKHISTLTGIHTSQEGGVIRVKDTPQQAHIPSKALREKNMENAFFCNKNERFSGHPLIIVDDIVTTGTTVKQLLRAMGTTQEYTTYVVCLAHERV